MKRLAFALCAILVGAQAPGVPDNPIITHYRAYRTAIEAGNIEAAETEANAALQASIARDGEGGRTGILALNLAQVRLSRQRTAQAHDPAQRAFAIASRGSVAGLDPLMARLVLGRAELTDERAAQGRARLVTALQEASTRNDLLAEGHSAAVALGTWDMAHEEQQEAAQAWAFAAQFSAGAPGNPTLARGSARMLEGVSIISYAAARENIAMRNSGGRTNLRPVNFSEQYEHGRAALDDAMTLLLPLAQRAGATDGLTASQAVYAQAYAWRNLLRARLISSVNDMPERARRASEPASGATTANICAMDFVASPLPNFPGGALSDMAVGSVVVRVLASRDGTIDDIRVAGAAPSEGFRPAVENVMRSWRLERTAATPANCQLERVLFFSVSFWFR